MSNQEIFFRTTEAIAIEKYDLVVVMWSEADRKWAYLSKDNVDDFTIITHQQVKGLIKNTQATQEYANLHYGLFNNRYVNIKHWLLNCLSLEQHLKNSQIPFIFIKGFKNNIVDLTQVTYDQGFLNIDLLKQIVDFDNRPDDYILKKIKNLQHLIAIQDKKHWLNLLDQSFFELTVDRSDDHLHPGPTTNKILASMLIDFYKELNE